MHPKSCPGYQLTFPSGQWANSTSYLFALHNLLSLPWYYSTCKEGFFLMSHSCLGLAVAGQRCGPCDNLGGNEYLKNIIAKYTDGIHNNSPLVSKVSAAWSKWCAIRHQWSMGFILVVSMMPENLLGKRVSLMYTSKCSLLCQCNTSLVLIMSCAWGLNVVLAFTQCLRQSKELQKGCTTWKVIIGGLKVATYFIIIFYLIGFYCQIKISDFINRNI